MFFSAFHLISRDINSTNRPFQQTYACDTTHPSPSLIPSWHCSQWMKLVEKNGSITSRKKIHYKINVSFDLKTISLCVIVRGSVGEMVCSLITPVICNYNCPSSQWKRDFWRLIYDISQSRKWWGREVGVGDISKIFSILVDCFRWNTVNYCIAMIEYKLWHVF